MRPCRLIRARAALRTVVAAMLLAATGTPATRADELMRQVQEELRKRNLYFGDVNGLYSPQVAAALRRYQQRKGFQATGTADDTTLHSLSLPAEAAPAVPPGLTPGSETTAPPANPALDQPPPTDGADAPWPDLPVIRSDQGRESAEPPAEEGTAPPDSTPTPPPKPPPAAAFQHGPSEGEVRGFVEDFLQRGESNDPDAQQSFFADQVDYFNEGKVDRTFITKDTARYNKRWPSRHFALVEPVQLSETQEVSPEQWVVNFLCAFDVKQSVQKGKDPKEVKGTVENTYTLIRSGPEKWRIVRIKERRIANRKTHPAEF